MLREPQHERKILIDIKPPPFVLSTVEGFLKTAKQIGLTIPPNVLARADRVIK